MSSKFKSCEYRSNVAKEEVVLVILTVCVVCYRTV